MMTEVRCLQCSESFPKHVVDQFNGMCPACVAGFAEVPPEEGDLKKGSTFGRYEIMDRVGRGGMGVVYTARQPGLDRVVALKVLSPRLAADEEFVRRFEREARTLARLNHPHIVAVHDSGVEAGTPYLVMEYVEGVSLRRLLSERRLPPEEALGIVPQLCDALEYAHAQGVIHRDVKPENILIDTGGRVKIADFGLAVMLGLEAPRLTQTNAVIGTPHYMAPEQVENPKAVDHRADIYSMGVVFYEMLTGELPLGHFSMPSAKARVHRRLDEIVLRALAKEPERRYQQVTEFKQDVASAPRGPAGRVVRGFEWRSEASILGWPLVHVCFGVDGRGRPVPARGVIAIGNLALGWVALGASVAIGGIALGGGVGVGLFSLGGAAFGLLLAFGGAAIGGVALGGAAVGYVAVGGAAAGYYACGGGAAGVHVLSSQRQDATAREFFERWPVIGDWTRRAPGLNPQAMRDDVHSELLKAGGDPDKRYFIIGPKKDAKQPAAGWGLALILPGGDGGEGFHPFVKRVWENVLADGYVAAQLVAREWKPAHFDRVVWPTAKNPVAGMRFTTEEFAEAVIADVGKRHRIDPKRVFVLAWSSGGPAGYAISLSGKKLVRGSLIAMSVFQPAKLDLAAAKGQSYYLYHSKDDKICPFRGAETAAEKLREGGATVELATYGGGHGWRGNVYADLAAGFAWLKESEEAKR